MSVPRRLQQYLFYVPYVAVCLAILMTPVITVPRTILYPASADDSEGWYRDGAPIIEKDPYKDDACYFGKQLTLSDGSASGAMSWTDVNCLEGGKCSGTYTGSMTWTSPPTFMRPGSKVEFKLAEKTSAQNSCGYKNIGSGGWVKVNGAFIVEVRDSLTPTATGAYTVTTGSPGSKLTVAVTAKAANLSGKVTYNYTYKGTATSPSSTSPSPPENTTSPKANQPPGPLVGSLPAPQGQEPLGYVTPVGAGPIYVSAGPWDLPPSQQKWILINGKQPLYDGWIFRTGPGAEATVLFSTGAFTRFDQNSWFEIKPLKMAETSQAVMYGRLFEGIANFYYQKQREESKKFEVETERAIVGIKGTNFVLEASDAQTVLKVIEGIVEFTSKQSGQMATVEAGQTMASTASGLGQKTSFDAAVEKSKWGDMTIPATGSSGAASQPGTPGSSSTPQKPGISLPKCPITTSLEVAPTSPRLAIFRNFRDKVLARSDAGAQLISLYYLTGTWIVDNLLNTESARSLARATIVEPLSLGLHSSSFVWNN